MARGKILVVDDEEAVRVTLGAVLTDDGHKVTLVSHSSEALARLQTTEFDIVLTDLLIDESDGLRIIEEAQQRWPETVSLVLTGYASVDSAIGALRRGAYDYLCKPCAPEELLATVGRALERRRLKQQVRHHTRDLETAIMTARELHSSLSAQMEGTSALLREREQVLVTICSELKTSLVAIAGIAQMGFGRAREDEDDLRGHLKQIRSETEHLAQRVQAALQITRTESVEQVPASARRALSEISLAELALGEVAATTA